MWAGPRGTSRAAACLRAEGKLRRRRRRQWGLPEGHGHGWMMRCRRAARIDVFLSWLLRQPKEGHRRGMRRGRAVRRETLLSRLLVLWPQVGTVVHHLRGAHERRSVAKNRIEVRAGGRPSVRAYGNVDDNPTGLRGTVVAEGHAQRVPDPDCSLHRRQEIEGRGVRTEILTSMLLGSLEKTSSLETSSRAASLPVGWIELPLEWRRFVGVVVLLLRHGGCHEIAIQCERGV